MYRDYNYSNAYSRFSWKSNQISINYMEVRPTNLSYYWDSSDGSNHLQWRSKKELIDKSVTISQAIYRRLPGDLEWGDKINTNESQITYYPEVAQYEFTDKSIETCTNYEYKVVTKIGTDFIFESSILPTTTSTITSNISDLNVSKGLYSDAVDIKFVMKQGLSDVIVERKKYNSNDEWREIGHITDIQLNKVTTFSDTRCGSEIYQYQLKVTDRCNSSDATVNKEVISYFPEQGAAIGFKKLQGVVSGRVTFEGGNSVDQVDVKAISSGVNRNKALFFRDPAYEVGTSYIESKKTDGFDLTKDFTVQVWVGSTVQATDTASFGRPMVSVGAFCLNYWRSATKRQLLAGINKEVPNSNGLRKVASETPVVECLFDNQLTNEDVIPGVGDFVWDHLTLVHRGDQMIAYLNGDSIKSMTFANDALTATSSMMLAGGFQGASALDELRFWNRALSTSEVGDTYNTFLTGDEKGLAGYWKFDEAVSDQVFDYSNTENIPNENHGSGFSLTFTQDVPTEDQLSCRGLTDEKGNYIIPGIPLTDEGLSYRIKPQKEGHTFEPVEEILYFNNTNNVHNKISFTDKSSFEVNGVCYYQDTQFPVEGANIYIDGVAAFDDGALMETDQYGEFRLNVPIGEHAITVKKNGHTFAFNGRFPTDQKQTINIDRPFTIQEPFWDTSLYRVVGRIAGGPAEFAKPLGFNKTVNNLGKCMLTLKATFKENFQLTTDPKHPEIARKVRIQHPRYAINEATKDTIHYYTQIVYSKYGPDYLIDIIPDSITGEFVADLIPENFYPDNILAGVDEAGKPYNLSDDKKFPIELAQKSGNNEFLTMETGDTITILDESTQQNVAEVVKDSIPYSGVSKNYIRRNPAQVDVTDLASETTYFGDINVYVDDPNNSGKKIEIPTISFDDQGRRSGYLMNNLPVFTQGSVYKLKVKLTEKYRNPFWPDERIDEVPVSDGIIYVNNNLSADNSVSLDLNEKGEVIYGFIGGTPSLTPSTNSKMSYTEQMNITAISGDGDVTTLWRPESDPLTGYLLGGVITGSNFTTMGPQNVDFVLRDPPGSNSYSVLHKGSYTGSTYSFEYNNGSSQDVSHEFIVGARIETFLGTPVSGVITDGFENDNRVGLHVTSQEERVQGNNWQHNYSIDEDFTTSSSPEYVGAMADIYIGSSYNLVFSDAKTVRIYPSNVSLPGLNESSKIDLGNGYYLAQREARDCSPEFETMFMYTQDAIVNKLIPDLQTLRNNLIYDYKTSGISPDAVGHTVYLSTVPFEDENFGQQGYYKVLYPTNVTQKIDSVALYNTSIQNWQVTIGRNEADKFVSAKLNKANNLSFDAGAIYEKTCTDAADSTEITHGVDWQFSSGVTGTVQFAAKGIGMSTSGEIAYTHSSSSRGEAIKGRSVSTTMHLEDEDAGNFYSVDVYDSDAHWGPVFKTVAGQTSCPYEGATYVEYFDAQNDSIYREKAASNGLKQGSLLNVATAQIDKPLLRILNATKSDVPGNKSAVYDLILTNESESKTDLIYTLQVLKNSNPDGAVLAVDGKNLATPLEMYIPYGEQIKKTLTLSRTREDVFRYDTIQLALRSACQNDPTSNFPVIESVAKVSAFFVPSCGDILINKRLDHAIVNMTEMDPTIVKGMKGVFPIEISGYDVNNTKLDKILLYYKSANESETSWKLLQDYYRVPTQDQTPLQGGSFTYDWDLAAKNVADGTYNVKAVAYGAENIKSETDVVTFVKNTVALQVFGNPQPSDGILSPQDEISIAFNKNIQGPLVIKNKNLKVTGVLNNEAVTHQVGALFDDATNYLIIPNGVNLMNKSFSLEFWLKSLNQTTDQTLFTHGQGAQLFNMGFTADSKIVLTMGTQSVVSDLKLTADQYGRPFAKYVVCYKQPEQLLTVSVNNQLVLTTKVEETAFCQAPLIFGYDQNRQHNFHGVVQDIRLWNQAIDESSLDYSLTGNEVNLAGNWSLNEGEGEVAQEKVRDNHGVMKTAWFIDPIGKSVVLDGSHYVGVPLYALSENYDFTYELWFKGGAQSAEATLFSNGKATQLSATPDKEFNLCVNTKGQLVYYCNQQSYTVSSENWMDNEWHHITLVADRAGSTSFYVDGILTNSYRGVGLTSMKGSKISLGACTYTDSANKQHTDAFFKGSVDEFRFWKKALDEYEIKNLWLRQLSGSEIGLSDYYPFDGTSTQSTELVDSWNNKKADKTDVASWNDVNGLVASKPALTSGVGVLPTLSVSNIPFTWTFRDNQIMISLDDSPASLKSYENATLTIGLEDLYDEYNNPSKPYSWTAYVDLKPVRWAEKSKSIEIEQGETLTFERDIKNISGVAKRYVLSNLPSWLTVTPASGTLQAGEVKTLTFAISSGLNIGSYDPEIALQQLLSETSQEVLYTDKMSLNLKVGGKNPGWSVNPANFEYSMNIYGELYIKDVPSTDVEDMVAAFDGEQCVGVASPYYVSKYGKYELFMRVYGNEETAKNLKFRIWDASTGVVYPAKLSQTVTFAPNAVYGSIANPVKIDTEDEIYQNIPLERGWNWISFNVKSAQLDHVKSFLSVLNGADGDVFKSQNKFMMYSPTAKSWEGSFTDDEALSNLSMYMLKTQNMTQVNVAGTHLDLATNPLSIAGGKWNYISYLPESIMSVNAALANYQATEDDLIKSKTAFALYDPKAGWIGNLEYMNPGQGYILLRKGGNTTFHYPTYNTANKSQGVSRTMESDHLMLNSQLASFSDNMTMVAQVVGYEMQPGTVLKAAVNESLRGEATAIDYQNEALYFININGLQEEKNQIRFYIEKEGETVAEAKTTVPFSVNNQYGQLNNPYLIHFNDTKELMVSAYPVPFQQNLTIDIYTPEAGSVELRIYDTTGRLIQQNQFESNGFVSYHWDSSNTDGMNCDSGIYILKVYSQDSVKVLKVKKQ